MKNFIENIKEHKLLALICFAVVVISVIFAVVLSSSGGDEKNSPSDTQSPEQDFYFTETDYPVCITETENGLNVKIESKTDPDIKWQVYAGDDMVPLTENIVEDKGTLYMNFEPVQTGYSTVSFVKSADIGEISYEIVTIDLDVYVSEDNDGMKLYFDDIQMYSSQAGAGDTEIPFVLSGDRVILPNGGDWTLSPEEGSGILYGIRHLTDEEGTEYFLVNKNIASVLGQTSEFDPAILDKKLILKSEKLGVEYRLEMKTNDENRWTLRVAEDENE